MFTCLANGKQYLKKEESLFSFLIKGAQFSSISRFFNKDVEVLIVSGVVLDFKGFIYKMLDRGSCN